MLSIIIIAKNEEKSLPHLLKSIQDQSFKDYEIIVSDANSKDRTKKIARKFGCRVVKGGIPSIGRNNGAKVARGEMLLFLDSDVILPKNFLSMNLTEFEKRDLGSANPRAKPITDRYLDKVMYFGFNIWSKIMQFVIPCALGPCIFCKKEVFIKTGGFNENLKLMEDLDFINRTREFGKFRILKSLPILLEMRRFEKAGRLNQTMQYIYIGLYFTFFRKPKSDLVQYKLHGQKGSRH